MRDGLSIVVRVWILGKWRKKHGKIGALDALLYALLYIFGLAFAFYPLTRWCKQNEGFSWPWPHVQSEKKRIKELRREQQAQENEEKGEK